MNPERLSEPVAVMRLLEFKLAGRALRFGVIAVALVGAMFALTGCTAKVQRVLLHEDAFIKVVLRTRSEAHKGAPAANFAHPAAISRLRLAHLLSQLELRDAAGERRPAFHTELVFTLGEHIEAALRQAAATQEVVIQALRKERQMGLFTHTFVTAFVCWLDSDERLQIHLQRADWRLPPGEDIDDLREPVAGRAVLDFRVMASEGIVPLGAQSVAVNWRDPRFQKPREFRVGSDGRMQRRRILLESPAPDSDSADE